jgi:glycosyltransferase involved in cell wall biosynthesis
MKITFLLLDDLDYLTSRRAIAQALLRRGSQATVIARPLHPSGGELPGGVRLVPWRILSGSLNVFREAGSLLQVLREYRRQAPDAVFHVALKPVIYGGIAARIFRIPAVHVITGLGYGFLGTRWYQGLLRQLLVALIRVATGSPRSRIICQNEDDAALLASMGALSRSRTRVIPGSGIDLQAFAPGDEPTGVPVVVLAGRMLKEKGVDDFCHAAVLLRNRGVQARLVLVGEPDPANPGSLPESDLRRWAASGAVEWWGQRGDMPAVLQGAALVCLPSYGEGLPRVLAEAAACGRAIVATDVPGCRAVVQHGVNGILVPPRDASALAEAIEQLLADDSTRMRMGRHGRRIASERFGRDRIVQQTIATIDELVGDRSSSRPPDTASASTAE